MIHCVLHDPGDSVAVVVVEGVKAGQTLTGLILDEDRTITLACAQDIPLGHKVALKVLGQQDGKTAFDDISFAAVPFYNGTAWFRPLMTWWFRARDRLRGN